MFQGMSGREPGYPWWRLDKYGLMDYAAALVIGGVVLGLAGACGLGYLLRWLAERGR